MFEGFSPGIWTVIVAAVGATCWITGRLHGKVDWKVIDKLKEDFADIRVTLGRVDERTKNIETHLNGGKKPDVPTS